MPEVSKSSNITDTTVAPSSDYDRDEKLPYFVEASPIPGASYAALEMVESHRSVRSAMEAMEEGQSDSNTLSKVPSERNQQDGDLEKTKTNHTVESIEIDEGWRNRGWLVVIGAFLVNFCVFGITFSWGIFQDL
ncbi:hypothetical protein VKS41_001061 [Umbelopsis sp. WA50703]|jgi:hypothetical protein